MNQHRWVAEVLLEIYQYSLLNELHCVSTLLADASKAAQSELLTGSTTSTVINLRRKL